MCQVFFIYLFIFLSRLQELLGNITVKDGSSSNKFDDEEEDLIEKDKRDEMERLKKQGIRQQKLEAIRKEEEERCGETLDWSLVNNDVGFSSSPVVLFIFSETHLVGDVDKHRVLKDRRK